MRLLQTNPLHCLSLLLPNMSIKRFLLAATLFCIVSAQDPLSCTGPLDTQCCKDKGRAACSFEIGGVTLSGNCVPKGRVSLYPQRVRKDGHKRIWRALSLKASCRSSLRALTDTMTDSACFPICRAFFLLYVSEARARRAHRVYLARFE